MTIADREKRLKRRAAKAGLEVEIGIGWRHILKGEPYEFWNPETNYLVEEGSFSIDGAEGFIRGVEYGRPRINGFLKKSAP